MSEVANIYDNGPISPVAKIKENLTIWSQNEWMDFVIEFIEPIPRSNAFTIDTVAAAGVASIAANGVLNKQVIAVLQMNLNDLLHLRWEPIDDVEGRLWELAEAARFAPRGAHGRVSLMTGIRDPFLATTTFWILGANKDMQLEVLNPNPVIAPVARFAFWGYRYVLKPLKTKPATTTYLPAQAMVGVR